MRRKKKKRKFFLYYLPEFTYNKSKQQHFLFRLFIIEKALTITAGAFSFHGESILNDL